MVQPRRIVNWLLAGLTFLVLVAVFYADFSTFGEREARRLSRASSKLVDLPMPPVLPAPVVDSSAADLPHEDTASSSAPTEVSEPQEAAPVEPLPSLAGVEVLPENFTEHADSPSELLKSLASVAKEMPITPAATETASQTAPSAGKVATQVGEAIAESPSAPIPESASPAKNVAPGVANAGDSTAGSMAVTTDRPDDESVPATDTAQPAPLPDWMHRLPEVVASVPRTRPSAAPIGEVANDKRYPDTNDPTAKIGKPETRGLTQKVDDSWREPEALIETLNELVQVSPASKWATETLHQIRAFGSTINSQPADAVNVLQRLVELERQAPELAAKMSDRVIGRKLKKAGYALARRIDVWEQMIQIGTSKSAEASVPGPDAETLAACLAEIDSQLGESGESSAWRQYLMLDALKECAARPTSLQEPFSREIARQVLVRLIQTPLTPQQRRLISHGPFATLQVELQKWTAEPVGVATVLRDIERYERTGSPSDACRLAADRQNLLASSSEARRQLATRVDGHYRNANLRITMTEKLLNQLIPEQNLEYSQVRDTVQGRPVSGQSVMATELGVRMIPDPKRVLIAMEVRGEIAALTTAAAGPVRVHNDSELYYLARKPMEINMTGIKVWPVEIYIDNDSQVRGVETDLDLPLIGAVIRGVAKSQAEQVRPAANAEVRQKVATQATERIDGEVRKQLKGVVERMNQRVFDPLNSLALDPEMVDAETNKERFTMRLRVGGEDQLGSHTPRPQAPANSLASVQLHESVLNNGIQRLQLDGRTFMLPEFSKHIAARLNLPSAWETSPENEDVRIIFADRDAITVRCQDGQMVMTLSIAQLSKGTRRWHNFQVRAFYKPEVNGRSAELVRDGVIHLIGQRVSAGSQIALRGIFARVFSRNAPWQLVPEQLVKDPRLKDAAITQFVIEDGWIGLSLGPKPPVLPTARRQRWQ